MVKQILLIIAVPILAFSQSIVTDRPTFSTGASIVPKIHMQVESGFQFSKQANATESSLPNLLLRYAPHSHLEFRFGGTGWSRVNVNDASETFRQDALAEAKILLTTDAAPADISTVLVSTLPVGDPEVTSGDAAYGIKLVGDVPLSPTRTFTFNVGAINEQVGTERYITTIMGVVYSSSFSKDLSAFAEFYGEAPEHETWTPLLNGGLVYLTSPSTQVDIIAGIGLNNQAPDFLFGIGFSHLF